MPKWPDETRHVQATKEDFAYRHAHSKMSQNFTVSFFLKCTICTEVQATMDSACTRTSKHAWCLMSSPAIIAGALSDMTVFCLAWAPMTAPFTTSCMQVGGDKDHGFDRERYERLLREHSRYQRYLRLPAAEGQ